MTVWVLGITFKATLIALFVAEKYAHVYLERHPKCGKCSSICPMPWLMVVKTRIELVGGWL